MSGAKRRTKYRKHVEDMALNALPEPGEGAQIVQVTQSAGGNLFEVEAEGGATALALLPTKFRNLIWVRRGHFLLVSSSGDDYETSGGDKGRVRFLVEHILSNDQVKNLVEGGKWPESFRDRVDKRGNSVTASVGEAGAAVAAAGMESAPEGEDEEDEEEGADGDDPLFQNRNRDMPSDSSSDEA